MLDCIHQGRNRDKMKILITGAGVIGCHSANELAQGFKDYLEVSKQHGFWS